MLTSYSLIVRLDGFETILEAVHDVIEGLRKGAYVVDVKISESEDEALLIYNVQE